MNTYRSIVIAGAKGMLASAFIEQLRGRGLSYVGFDYDTCDITDASAVNALFDRQRPTLLINCAAHTRVDACETEEEKANAINGHAVAHLAAAARRHGTVLVHFSTDFVFDGNGRRPYRVDDPPNPVSAYGRSKLLGENLLQQENPPGWLIVRTAWLYGRNGASFPRTMVERARAGQPLKVVSDQVGSPTYTADLAAAVLHLLDHGATGLFHLTNAGQTNWHEFAVTTLKEFGLACDVPAITAADWKRIRPDSAPRPAYSVLDLSAYERATGKTMRPWTDSLHDFRLAVEQADGF